jgi:hypothetical protein
MDLARRAHRCDVTYTILERSRFTLTCHAFTKRRTHLRKLTTGYRVYDNCDEPSRHKERNVKTLWCVDDLRQHGFIKSSFK